MCGVMRSFFVRWRHRNRDMRVHHQTCNLPDKRKHRPDVETYCLCFGYNACIGLDLIPNNDLRWNFQRCGRTEWYVIDDSYAAELHSYISKNGIVGGIYGLIARKCMMISFIIVAAITILKLFMRRGKWNHFQLL